MKFERRALFDDPRVVQLRGVAIHSYILVELIELTLLCVQLGLHTFNLFLERRALPLDCLIQHILSPVVARQQLLVL